MAFFIGSTGEFIGFYGGSDVFVLSDATLWTTTDNPVIQDAIEGTGANSIRVDGTIYGGDAVSIRLYQEAPGIDSVLVGETGRVVSGRGVSAIFLEGARAQVTNLGEISGGVGVMLSKALFGGLRNHGTLVGTDGPAVEGSLSNSLTIQNSGTLSGREAIRLSGGYATIKNGGLIQGTGPTRPPSTCARPLAPTSSSTAARSKGRRWRSWARPRRTAW